MNRLKYLIVFLCVLFVHSVYGQFTQLGTSSPYSRFGLGDLQENVFPRYKALGGGVTAISSTNSVNPYNPGTYAYIKKHSFLLSTGGLHQTTLIQNLTDNQITNNNTFSHLTVGFPITNRFGASAGLLPYSNIGYVLNDRNDNYNTDIIYSGDGGLSKIYFGAAYQLLEEFSLGINASYLFGGLNRRIKQVFNDESFFNSRSNSKINLRGYFYEAGILYQKKLNSKKIVSFGLTANNNSKINAKRTKLVETFSVVNEIIKDTVQNTIELGDAVLPKYISAGMSYRRGDKLLFVADYSTQSWTEYLLFDEGDDLNNSMFISAGLEYIPKFNSVTKYYKRMQYRLGGSYSNTPLVLNNTQLKEISISFGLGFPVRKSKTIYDLSMTLGQRGTTNNNLIKEQFLRIGLSVSYEGIWFVKRKYD